MSDSSEILKGQATLELRRSIVSAMERGGMTAAEIISVLESAIGVLKSGDLNRKGAIRMKTQELEKDLLITDKDVALHQPNSIMGMIDYAVRNGTAIEVLKELRAMRDEDRRYNARLAFDEAMKAAQDEISTVIPDCENTQTKSKYASFKALNAAIRPVYLKHGFSLTFNAAPSPVPEEVYVLCNVSHSGGHTQPYMAPMSTNPSGPKGGGVMNKMQAYSASLSYGRSNLLKLIFNIAIAEPEAGAEQRLDDVNERLENMRDGDRKSLDKVYADAWGAAVKINDLKSLWEFIRLRITLCQSVDELKGVARSAFDGVAVFKNEQLNKAITASFNARRGELA